MIISTGKSEGRSVLIGKLIPDSKHDPEFVRLGPNWVKNWIWDELRKLPKGKRVRITIEVLDDSTT